MSRTITTFGLLQAITAVVALAVLFWSLGLPSLRFAQAANVTQFSNTLSTSEPNTAADHTIVFTTPSGVDNGETITIDFSHGPFTGMSSTTVADILVNDGTTDLTTDADCSGAETSAVFAGEVLTITFCVGEGASIPPNGTTTISIGENAGGTNQLINPAVAGSYRIELTAGSDDIGTTRVAIVAPVEVTATVNTVFNFTVDGVNAGGDVNGAVINGTSTAIAIPFGVLTANDPVTLAQQLSVETNAAYGFAVTAQVDQQLSSGSAEISAFIDGSYTSTPTPWQGLTPNISNSDTWGHWGLTTDDETVGVGDPFDVGGVGEHYVAASTTPVTVFAHGGPADNSTQNIGTARVGYTVEISALQPAGVYTATLTYVATPVF
jgi:hypothetical protein